MKCLHRVGRTEDVVRLTSSCRTIGNSKNHSDEAILAEPNLKCASVSMVERHGGPIVHSFCDTLPSDWHRTGFTMFAQASWLVPGYYPNRFGWHRDGTRDRLKPEPGKPTSEHIMVAFGKPHVARTEFALGYSTLPRHMQRRGDFAVSEEHECISRQVARGDLTVWVPGIGEHILFDSHTSHTPPLVKEGEDGLRLLICATRLLRSDVQVLVNDEVQAPSGVKYLIEGDTWRELPVAA